MIKLAQSREDLLQELAAVAMARPINCLSYDDGKLELRPLDQLSGNEVAGIASIERSTTGVKVKFHDKLRALEMLLKYDNTNGCSETNLLKMILEATSGPIDTEGVNEIEDGIFIET